MACTRPNQGRYIVTSLPAASRKAVHLACWASAGNGTAYPIACLTRTAVVFSPYFTGLAHVRAPTSHPYRPAHSLFAPIPATIGAPNPHSGSCSVGSRPTSRDFVPWRFSEACRPRAWRGSSCRRQRNLVWGVSCQGGAPRVLSIFLSLSFFVRPGQPVSSSRPYGLMTPAARRSGQGWRVSATEGSSLRAPSTTAQLARVGDDDVEGSPACGARLFMPTSLYAVGTETQTKMQ